jgi:hypothetical protein
MPLFTKTISAAQITNNPRNTTKTTDETKKNQSKAYHNFQLKLEHTKTGKLTTCKSAKPAIRRNFMTLIIPN